MNSSQYVIVELRNGNKCEGIISSIDKVNFKMYLNSAKKYFTDDSGNLKEENLDTLEINKEDIKEVKLVQYEQPKEEYKNINAIPEAKVNQWKSQDNSKGYDKSESFFDNLSAMSNNDAKNLSIKYNDKNLETFNLPKESLNSNNNNFKQRGGYRKNRGNRNNRGGFRGNYNNNYNNNQYQEQGQYQDDFNGGNRRGYKGGYNRGGTNFNQKYQNYNQGYNQEYNQNYNPSYPQNYNQNFNQNYNQRQYNPNNKFYNEGAYTYNKSSNQEYQHQDSGKEKSIYDQF